MKRRTIGGKLKAVLLRLDRPYKFAAHLAFFGIIGTIVGSYFQYNSWRDEKNLARYESELSSAIAISSETVTTLSAVMNLQQMLLFTFANAEGYEGPVSEHSSKYLADSAREIHTRYFNARTNLRESIDALAGKAALFLDRPVEPDPQRVAKLEDIVFLPSNRDQLRSEGFDCEQDVPTKHTLSQLKEHKINWDSVREQTETFYYCLDEIHSSLLFVRVWAQSGVAEELDRADVQKRVDKLKTDVGIQASRLRALISTSNDKIEALRLRDRPQGFFQHQL